MLLSNNPETMETRKKQFSNHFKIKDLGKIKQILGIAIDYDQEAQTLNLSQTRYIEDSLNRHGLSDGHTHRTPFGSGTKLSKDDSPSTAEEKDQMKNLP